MDIVKQRNQFGKHLKQCGTTNWYCKHRVYFGACALVIFYLGTDFRFAVQSRELSETP